VTPVWRGVGSEDVVNVCVGLESRFSWWILYPLIDGKPKHLRDLGNGKGEAPAEPMYRHQRTARQEPRPPDTVDLLRFAVRRAMLPCMIGGFARRVFADCDQGRTP